jgi:hypothetical protein
VGITLVFTIVEIDLANAGARSVISGGGIGIGPALSNTAALQLEQFRQHDADCSSRMARAQRSIGGRPSHRRTAASSVMAQTADP